MALVKLDIPPGVYRNATPYQAGPRWHDANLVRWDDGSMLPVGGWERTGTEMMIGVCRSLYPWKTNGGLSYMAVGTNQRLYAHDQDKFIDITPAGFTAGRQTALPGLGYGAGPYGAEAYGTPRTGESSLVLDAATWTFDSWGENLVACCLGDGKIYEWGLSQSTPAAQVANSPDECRALLVTEQRHLMALGAEGDPKLVMWSEQENNTVWTPTELNQAGDFRLSTNGEIRCGVKIRGEILILTSEDAHVARFIGQPLIFSFERVGTDCGVASPSAWARIGSGAIWMGRTGNFYRYDGAVAPMQSEVGDYILQTLDYTKVSQVTCGHLSERHEIWWFYPSIFQEAPTEVSLLLTEDDEPILTEDDEPLVVSRAWGADNDSYVVWNYLEGWWSIGKLPRTAWTDRGIFSHPMAASQDGYLYQHERGFTDAGQSRAGSLFAESGAIEIGNGDRTAWITQVMPDEKTAGDVTLTLKTRFTPTGAEVTSGPYTIRSDGYTDTRAQGRQVKVRIDAARDAAWRVGTFRAYVKPGSGR